MKITSATKTIIVNALSDKGLNMTELGKKIGKSRSWVSKLLGKKNEITHLTPEVVDDLNDVLGVELNPIQFAEGSVSPTMMSLSRVADSNPDIAQLMETVLAMATTPNEAYIPTVDQKELEKIGANFSRIVKEWDQEEPHNAKIGAECLTYLRKFFVKTEKK